jgi:hypothetical protein
MLPADREEGSMMRCKCLITSLLLLASLADAASCWSADQSVPTIPSSWPVKEAADYFGIGPRPITPETLRLVNDLQSNDFSIRERASKALKEKGSDAFPGLHEAVLASNDPELIARAGDLLWNSASRHLQHAPAYLSGPVLRYLNFRKRLPSRIDVALSAESLPDAPKVLLFRLLLQHETDPSLRASLQQFALSTAPTQARLQLLAGNWQEAEHLLRTAIPSNDAALADYAALVVLRHGPPFDTRAFLQGVDLNALDPAKRGQLACYLYRAQGDLQAAADAELTFPPDANWRSIRPTLLETGRYAELAASIESTPGRKRCFFTEVIAYSLAGETDRAGEILDGVIRRPGRFGTNNIGNVIMSLVAADRAEAAIQLSQKDASRQAAAFRLLAAQWRFREAIHVAHAHQLSTVEIPLFALHLGLKAEAAKLLDPMARDTQRLAAASSDQLSLIANLFDASGEPQKAAAFRKQAFALADHNRALVLQQRDTRIFLQDLNDQTHRKNTTPPTTGLAVLADPRFTTPEDLQLADFWINRTIAGNHSVSDNVEDVQNILRGAFDAERLVRSMDLPDVDNWRPFYALRLFVKTLDRLHRRDLAKELLLKWSEKSIDPTCLAQLGDWALDDEHPSEAVQWYRKAAMLNLTDASLMYRLGVACSRIPANAADGRALIAFAPILVLGDLGQAQRLWTAMRQYEGNAAADHWYDEYLDRFCGLYPETMAANHTRKRDAAEARGDYAAALRFAQQLLFTPDQSLDEYSRMASAMLGVAAYHRSRALDAWSRKDFPTLADALWRQMDNGPPDPDLLERTGPALRLADHAAFLRILHRALSRVEPITQDYPAIEPYSSTLTRLKALDI